ncbi:MAG: DeoR family transcriptional regulator [Candidatus Paceibacterota bacterium]
MDINNGQNSSSFNDPLNWRSLGFFTAEEYLLFIFKKTEKITAALYLVSGLLKDDEPLKWELRDRGVELLNSSFTASSSMPVDRSSIIQSLFTSALETISLLNVARVSNLISTMNHSVLVKEIDQVLGLLRDRLAASAENAGLVLSEKFFKTPDLFSSGFKPAEYGNNTTIPSGGSAGPVRQNRTEIARINSGRGGVQQKKDQRKKSIVDLLKLQGNLTIKDFSKVMKDCSEKTIQRELMELVNKGILKKEGERRWSRYSLK